MYTLNVRYIPNILSVSRIVLAILMFFLFGRTYWFFGFYLIAGVTDFLDGIIARKYNAPSSLGAQLDSIGDFCLYIVLTAYLIIKYTESVNHFKYLIITIIVLRALTIIFGIIKYHQLIMVHTLANKLSGLLLFFLPMLLWADIQGGIYVTMVVAIIAPLEEIIILFVSKEDEILLNTKTIFKRK